MTVKELIDALMKFPMHADVEIALTNGEDFYLKSIPEERTVEAVRADSKRPALVYICDNSRKKE